MRIPTVYPRRRARIEIIPLIDIMFFLLATFIMVSLSMIQNRAIPLTLPGAASAVPQDRKAALTLSIDGKGNLYWGKEEVTQAGMETRLAALVSSDPDPKVFLHGDKGAEFGAVVKLLDDVRHAGIRRVALRTKGRKGPAKP